MRLFLKNRGFLKKSAGAAFQRSGKPLPRNMTGYPVAGAFFNILSPTATDPIFAPAFPDPMPRCPCPSAAGRNSPVTWPFYIPAAAPGPFRSYPYMAGRGSRRANDHPGGWMYTYIEMLGFGVECPQEKAHAKQGSKK